jgi:hypothetical protein
MVYIVSPVLSARYAVELKALSGSNSNRAVMAELWALQDEYSRGIEFCNFIL